MGAGFSFVARQKRLQIDNDDYYIDLLFYNRRLRRLVAIELKLGEFKASDKGQMELYLRWLAKHEQEAGEAPPLGIILCTGKKREHVELLELDQTGIHVVEYLTELPSKEVLERKLSCTRPSRYRKRGWRIGSDRAPVMAMSTKAGPHDGFHQPLNSTSGLVKRESPARGWRRTCALPRPCGPQSATCCSGGLLGDSHVRTSPRQYTMSRNGRP